jgi:membrane-associated protease RseP (regulator of RpoE activity)
MLVPNFILFIFLWISSPVHGDSVAQIDPVVAAIQLGSSSELAKFFNPSIALNINGQQGDYSKNQAEIILKDFFKKNPPQGFALVFKNENTTSISTYIGEYASGQIHYKVFIKVSQSDQQFRIYSLDFVKS